MKTLSKISILTILIAAAVTVAAGSLADLEPADTEDAAALQDEAHGERSAAPEPLPEDYSCMFCHGEDGTLAGDDEQKHLIITEKHLAGDVHWQKGLRCHDCHGGNAKLDEYTDHRDDSSFRTLPSPAAVPEFCGRCHTDQRDGLLLSGGAHSQAGENGEDGSPSPLECRKCHNEKAHAVLPVDDSKSPVFLDNQVEICGGCHEEDLKTYAESVHGNGLYESGLLVTAACADCHGAHRIVCADDRSSTLNELNVAKTCGKCHRFIEERLQKSVHGRGNGPGGMAERPAPGGKQRRKPSCTDCHQGHDLPHPKSETFRLSLPSRCGNCHVDLSNRYAMSLHGQLTDLGYGPGAKCSDCHGAHDILATGDKKSRLAPGNRLRTCQSCHPHAVKGFCDFHPHADHKHARRHPYLYAAYLAMEILLYSVFGFFGIHTALWFTRSLIHVLVHGRAPRLRAQQRAYVRFETIHRVLHVIMILSFLGLALTGLPLKYSDQPWAQVLARGMGGFGSTSIWHHVCAVTIIFYFATHLLWLAWKILELRAGRIPWRTIVFGPDSPVPNPRDFVDLFRMTLWFFGLGRKPVFERWSYWEKFDYWAVFWGIGIIGASGFMLWFPNLFCRVLPGDALNVAKIIHSEEALLATGFIFAIHFFNTHLRPEKFPMDLSILAGVVTEEELRDERPEFLERLRREGKLDELSGKAPSRAGLWAILLGGALALAIGLGLLMGILLAGVGG